ncbi:helix-turn-helix domain-containing protein [Natronobacterium gregoryi]|uniref:Bacterio-opsin activator n=2 Tax=Natronobacterium gregoryi TaxID=44930 RepID=L0AKE5_NATGS|nr:helix-turn-helix domain-containing protein [Natronobacterium gregoryi]AFZ74271.1 putative DNA binding protein [Natronobacterium gregoryi SP2]ELY63729.1 DNA binding protein [Natronobacterium gregoryi SP2]PLK21946.1 bacterio-opsin activator [Natronobacterium gregoryi SP2]SFI52739.1 hypothetical protein SAMN05443661_101159 [Natronobacterium gregoryi]
MPSGDADHDTGSSAATPLRARFWIEPHHEARCSVLDECEGGHDVSQDLHYRDEDCGDEFECRSEVVDRTAGESKYLRADVGERCICPVFQTHDCIASIETVDEDGLSVAITTPSRTELEKIVTALRNTGASVRLERITDSAPSSSDDHVLEIATETLTEKQREAIVTAVESGYYERPRDADLADLADELGVSRSAVSQRLAAVESKLITSLVQDSSCARGSCSGY